MTAKQALKRVQALQREVKRDAQLAVSRTLTKAKAEARRESSGTFSLKELARKDYPYARRHPSPLLDPARINVQSGEFREHWNTSLPQAGDSIVSGRLYNLSRTADFLDGGTRYMVRRPIADRLADFVHTTAVQELTVAARRLERFYE